MTVKFIFRVGDHSNGDVSSFQREQQDRIDHKKCNHQLNVNLKMSLEISLSNKLG